MKRKLLIIYFVVIMIGSLTSCKASQQPQEEKISEEENSEDKDIKLVLTYASGDASWNKVVDLVTRRFMEQYPNIMIELSSGTASSGAYIDFLKNKDAVGELGDILDIRNMELLAESGRLAALPEDLASLVNNSFQLDGKTYAVTATCLTQGIIYNKKVFELLNLQEPKTYEEFLNICSVLKKYRMIPIVVGGKDLWHMGFWVNHFFRADVLYHNSDWQLERSNGTVSWSDNEPRQMLSHLKYLFEKGYVVEDYQKISDSSTASYIANSKAAMLYSGPWMFSKITELNPKIDLGWFYVPDDEGKYIAFNDVNSGWAITSDCAKDQKKYDAAVQFLKFFYSEDIYSQVCSIMNAMPVTNIDIKYESEVQDKVLQDFRKKAILTSDQIGSYDTPENFQNYLFMYVNDYIEGKYTLDEITGILDDTWDNCNNKPKD